MKASIILFAPAIVAGQGFNMPTLDDAKLWYDKAQAYIGAFGSAPRRATSAKVAEHAVTTLTWENWRPTLTNSGEKRTHSPAETWMVYVTGGNVTCGGQCGRADLAWNESVPFLVANPSAPTLATVDCESQELLCGAWGSVTPSIWMYRMPETHPDTPRRPTPLTIHMLNRTTVTASEVQDIYTKKLYMTEPPYEGVLHPFDGWIATNGLTEPMALTLYYISKVPSWAFMIGLSFVSRWFVNRRMPRAQPSTGGPAPAAQ